MFLGYCRVFLLQVCDAEITIIAITEKYYAMLFTFICSIISMRFIWYRKNMNEISVYIKRNRLHFSVYRKFICCFLYGHSLLL